MRPKNTILRKETEEAITVSSEKRVHSRQPFIQTPQALTIMWTTTTRSYISVSVVGQLN